MAYLFSRSVLIRSLERAVAASGSQKACAQSLGVSESYLSDVLKGKRIGPKLARALGYEPVEAFEVKRQ